MLPWFHYLLWIPTRHWPGGHREIWGHDVPFRLPKHFWFLLDNDTYCSGVGAEHFDITSTMFGMKSATTVQIHYEHSAMLNINWHCYRPLLLHTTTHVVRSQYFKNTKWYHMLNRSQIIIRRWNMFSDQDVLFRAVYIYSWMYRIKTTYTQGVTRLHNVWEPCETLCVPSSKPKMKNQPLSSNTRGYYPTTTRNIGNQTYCNILCDDNLRFHRP